MLCKFTFGAAEMWGRRLRVKAADMWGRRLRVKEGEGRKRMLRVQEMKRITRAAPSQGVFERIGG